MKEFFGKAVLSMAAQDGLLHGAVQQTEKDFFQRRAGRGDKWEETLSLQWIQGSAAQRGAVQNGGGVLGAGRLQLRSSGIYVNLRNKTFRANADGGGAPAVLCAFYGAAWPGS